MGEDFHQRQPLLPAEDTQELEENITLLTVSPRIVRNGSAITIDVPGSERGDGVRELPRERCKTVVALFFLAVNFLLTTTSLSITHELRQAKADPLPDVVLDNIHYYAWALDISEILIMVSTTICAVVVIFHKHRLIILRRICLLVGLLYGYRALTMIVTVLPAADPQYKCDPQLNHSISGAEVARRVVKILSGFGLSINGQHVYCGDFIFSGHTMILILSYLLICEYTPKKLWMVQWTAFGIAVAGVVTLLFARGHYSVDVILAYFITTRLWYMHNSVIHNHNLHQRSHSNYLSRLWWWRLAVWFEERVRGPVPNEYEIPRPWQIFLSSPSGKTRARDPGRDI